MSAIAEFPWPRLDAEEAAHGNRLFAASGRVSLPAKGFRYQVHFRPAFGTAYRPAIRAEARVGGRPVRLDMDRLPLPQLLGYPAGGLAPMEIPEELMPALLEGVLADFLEMAENFLGAPIRIDRVWAVDGEPEEDPPGYRIQLALREEGGKSRIRARLFLEREELASLAKGVEPGPQEGGEEWDDLPVRLRFRIGGSSLALDEFAGLSRGDILLLDRDPGAKEGLQVCAGESEKTLWTASMHEGLAVMEKENVVENPETGGNPSGTAGKLGAIEVQLAFDIGSRTATLAEIRDLAAGSVLELPDNPEGRVAIRVAGSLVGTGTLVMVDGKAGVRLESIWKEAGDGR